MQSPGFNVTLDIQATLRHRNMTTNSKGGFVRTEESAIQDSEALRLRSHGLTFREVAAHMCCDVSTAHRRVSRALGAIPRELADEYRALEALRLDALQQAVWEQAIEGDLKAVDRVLSIMKRRSQLLGLDAPKVSEQQPANWTIEQIDAEMDRIKRIIADNPDY